jgi:hypothetical protein
VIGLSAMESAPVAHHAPWLQPYEIRGLTERAIAPEPRLITETRPFLQCGGALPLAGVWSIEAHRRP